MMVGSRLQHVVAAGLGGVCVGIASARYYGPPGNPLAALIGAIGCGMFSLLISAVLPERKSRSVGLSDDETPSCGRKRSVLIALSLIPGSVLVCISIVGVGYLTGQVHSLDVMDLSLRVGTVGAISSTVVACFWWCGQVMHR